MLSSDEHMKFMRLAIELGQAGVERGDGGPFGAVVVKEGRVVGRGWNQVTSSNDPTAHAEVSAIRDACKNLQSFQLDDCTIYTSCEPCPMCLGAIYWARPKAIYFGCTKEDAASIDFDDAFIYREIVLPTSDRAIHTSQMGRDEAMALFRVWTEKEDKRLY